MSKDVVLSSARKGFSGEEVLNAWREQRVALPLIEKVRAWRTRFSWDASAVDAVAREVPQARFVYEGREIVEAALAAVLAGEHLLFVGPKATGKNVLAEDLSVAFGRPDWNVSFHIQTDAEALLGADTFSHGAVVFRPGPVVEVAEAGGFLILDEINMARNEALAVLHSLLDDRRMVDVRAHDGRARRRRAQDGDSPQAPAGGPRAPFRPRLAVRVAAARQDHAGRGDRALDGLDIVAVGQRGHGVAHGAHQGRVRARPHIRDARAGRPGDIRLHRVLLQPQADPLGAGVPQSRGVRAGQPARGGPPTDGGVGV